MAILKTSFFNNLPWSSPTTIAVCFGDGPAVCFASSRALKPSVLRGTENSRVEMNWVSRRSLTSYRWSIIWSLNSSAAGSLVAATCIYDEAAAVAYFWVTAQVPGRRHTSPLSLSAFNLKNIFFTFLFPSLILLPYFSPVVFDLIWFLGLTNDWI